MECLMDLCSISLSGSLIERLAQHLSEHAGHTVDIEHERAMGGGSINDAYRLDTTDGPYFVKVNRMDAIPSFFEAEFDGMARLRRTSAIRIPQIIAFGEDHDDAYLLMEHIDRGIRGEGFWTEFGRSMAHLHRHTQDQFGLERTNYIGTLKQVNVPQGDWAAYFQHRRL